ncbi:alpha/beta hydrolase fold domain-containing protein [Pseudomonas tohonis]|uniref:alpha/beta hydrolase fold domain-containing protein n=1 Tax=Pseudomonas tohonis TaxID=2725477 RepID=UPI0021D99996|nr:alpha/beta hydrolase [Pseudomonas tohonis]UXY52856.1 alpha/beta hydrolase [Pseudomonas tohonis]
MPSLQSRALVAFLRITRRKRIYGSAQAVAEGIARVRQQGPARPSAGMARRIGVEHRMLDGLDVYRLSPRTPGAVVRHVLYLHGGAYIRPITSHHWRFLQALVEQGGCTVTVPLYPLAPEATCVQTVEAMLGLYEQTCAEAGTTSLTLLGDSAGGGLALALCHALRERHAPAPRSLVLICPWLDVAMTHPSIAANEAHDPMLASVGLQEAGRLYAGELGVGHRHVSPIHGDQAGLPPTLLFAGTRDIAHYDELLFAEKAIEAGVELELCVGREMVHVWPILPIPEGREALARIVAHLRATS